MMPDTHVGSMLSLDGYWKIDSKCGRQFSAVEFEETLPAAVNRRNTLMKERLRGTVQTAACPVQES